MMRGTWKRILKGLAIILAALAAIFGLELARERIVYRRTSSRLESAHAQLKVGMTKDEVRRLAGEPEEVTERKPDEYWLWSARNRQGELWRRLGMTSARGHYDLIVRFDGGSRITKIFGGVN
jgi:outer membrane protein assembly factor BamE (lipoprotein component of BamABCDE complex)